LAYKYVDRAEPFFSKQIPVSNRYSYEYNPQMSQFDLLYVYRLSFYALFSACLCPLLNNQYPEIDPTFLVSAYRQRIMPVYSRYWIFIGLEFRELFSFLYRTYRHFISGCRYWYM